MKTGSATFQYASISILSSSNSVRCSGSTFCEIAMSLASTVERDSRNRFRLSSIESESASNNWSRTELPTRNISERRRSRSRLSCRNSVLIVETSRNSRLARLTTPRPVMKISNTSIPKPPASKISALWCTVNFNLSRRKAICKSGSGVSDETLRGGVDIVGSAQMHGVDPSLNSALK